MKHAEFLKYVRERISNKEAWTQRAPARNADGEHRMTSAPDAVCWCAIGSFWVTSYAHKQNDEFISAAFNYLEEQMGFDVAKFNDTHTHEEVLVAIDRAIVVATEMNTP